MKPGRVEKLLHFGSVVAGKSLHVRVLPPRKKNGKPVRVDTLTVLKRTAEECTDRVGMLDAELDDLNAERARCADVLRGALAGLLERGVGAVAEGSQYRAQLFETTVTTVDPRRLRTLVRDGRFFTLVKVELGKAAALVGNEAISRISITASGTPRLCVKQKENGS
mgnify:CR=1 FL=1